MKSLTAALTHDEALGERYYAKLARRLRATTQPPTPLQLAMLALYDSERPTTERRRVGRHR